jgi:electron transport complex protein RnfC
VHKPQNFEVLFGTPLKYLVLAAGGVKPKTTQFIMGGPMMGFNLPNDDVPITKAANCIIAASTGFLEPSQPVMPCIRCARCADVCPVSLQPQDLYWFAKSDNFEKARDYKLFDCIECGACSYVCPSNIPLVQFYRYAKSEIISIDKAKESADIARERNDFRLARIEREKSERAARNAERAHNAKKEASNKILPDMGPNSQSANNDNENELKAAKQASIAAAIERAKAAKALSGSSPENVIDASKEVETEIAAIDARRASVGIMTDEEKQAKIAATIAKAKAAKAAAESAKDNKKE